MEVINIRKNLFPRLKIHSYIHSYKPKRHEKTLSVSKKGFHYLLCKENFTKPRKALWKRTTFHLLSFQILRVHQHGRAMYDLYPHIRFHLGYA